MAYHFEISSSIYYIICYYRVENFREDNLTFDFDGIDKNHFLQHWYVYIARSDTCLSKQSWMKNECLYILLMLHWFYLRQPFSQTFICLFLSIAESKYNLYYISEYSCQFVVITYIYWTNSIYIFMKNFLKDICNFIRYFSYDLTSIISCIKMFSVILSNYSSSGLIMCITSKIGGIHQTHKMWQAVMRMYLVMKKDGWNISLFPTIVRIIYWYHLGVLYNANITAHDATTKLE